MCMNAECPYFSATFSQFNLYGRCSFDLFLLSPRGRPWLLGGIGG